MAVRVIEKGLDTGREQDQRQEEEGMEGTPALDGNAHGGAGHGGVGHGGAGYKKKGRRHDPHAVPPTHIPDPRYQRTMLGISSQGDPLGAWIGGIVAILQSRGIPSFSRASSRLRSPGV